MHEIRIYKWRIKLPESRIMRILLGIALIIGGIFGFLPILGFWMIPLGVAVLSLEIPAVRRWRRRFVVWFSRKWGTPSAPDGPDNHNSKPADPDETETSAPSAQRHNIAPKI